MRSFEQIVETSPKQPAFSNGTSWEIWAHDWCHRCLNDADEDCTLVSAALLHYMPREWVRTGLQDYECTEFEPREEDLL